MKNVVGPKKRRATLLTASVAVLALSACGSPGATSGEAAGGGEGITDDSVVIGTSAPLSGPNAAYGEMAKSIKACFTYYNEENGGLEFKDGKTRKVEHIIYDDAMEPARNLQNARRLVDQDDVFSMIGSPGRANVGSREYYNQSKVPQAFVASGSPTFGKSEEVAKYPWTMMGQPAYDTEASIYANFVHEQWPDGKVGVLTDDSGGPEFFAAFEATAKELGVDVVAHEEYSNSDPSVDAKVDNLKKAGADVFVDAAASKFAVQSLKRIKALNWDVNHIMWVVGSSVGGVLKPAGLDTATGVYSAQWLKDYSNPAFADDAEVKLYAEKTKQYDSGLELADMNVVQGWYTCNAYAEAAKNAEPNRQSMMDSLHSMKQVAVPMLIDGITITTEGDADARPIESLQISQFDGTKYTPVGDLISFEGGQAAG